MHHETEPKIRLLFGVVLALLTIVICQATVLIFFWAKRQLPSKTDRLTDSMVFQVGGGRNVIQNLFPDVDFTRLYPDHSSKEIDQLQKECFSVRYVYAPFVQFEPLPLSRKFVTILEHGFRKGTRRQPWPPRNEDFVIFVFGGSTTFGYGLPDGQTLPAALEDQIAKALPSKSVQCYNFGRGYYFSTQELMLFVTLLQQKIVPDVAFFVDGLNDYYYFEGSPDLTQALWKYTARDLPSKKKQLLATAEQKETAVRNVIERMAGNYKMAQALGQSYKVKTIFIGQPVSAWKYPKSPDTYPFQKELSDHVLCQWGYRKFEEAAEAKEFGENFIWCGDTFSDATTPMYVDTVHYSREGAARLAQTIGRRVLERGILHNNRVGY